MAKKCFALLLGLCLFCTAGVCAAESQEVADITAVAEYEGSDTALEAANATIYLPAAMTASEIPDAMKESGICYSGRLADPELTLQIMCTDAKEQTLQGIYTLIASMGTATNMKWFTLNGLPCISYDISGQDRCIVTNLDEKYVISFNFRVAEGAIADNEDLMLKIAGTIKTVE